MGFGNKSFDFQRHLTFVELDYGFNWQPWRDPFHTRPPRIVCVSAPRSTRSAMLGTYIPSRRWYKARSPEPRKRGAESQLERKSSFSFSPPNPTLPSASALFSYFALLACLLCACSARMHSYRPVGPLSFYFLR